MSAPRLFNRARDSVSHEDFLQYRGVITTAHREIDGRIEIEAEVAEPITACPHPGCEATSRLKGNGTEIQQFWDLPRGIMPVSVIFRKQLYMCVGCGRLCGRSLPFLPPAKSKITPRLERYIHSLLSERIPNSTIARWTGLDEKTIRNTGSKLDAACSLTSPPMATSGFVGLDDWKHGKRQKMRGILTDPINKLPIDLFESLKENHLVHDLGKHLAQHPEVRVIVIDMSNAFHSILRRHFPQLVIVADHFHVKQSLEKRVSRICDSLSESIAHPLSPAGLTGNLFGENDSIPRTTEESARKNAKLLRRKFRNVRRVWMKKPENRTDRDRNLIQAWSATYPLLREILECRDEFYRIWNAATNGENFKTRFEEWQASLPPLVLEQYAPFLEMSHRWMEEIAAYFNFPERPTNGFTEEMVNEVKHWNRSGRGISFKRLREHFREYRPKRPKMDGKSSEVQTAVASAALFPIPNLPRGCPAPPEQLFLPLV